MRRRPRVVVDFKKITFGDERREFGVFLDVMCHLDICWDKIGRSLMAAQTYFHCHWNKLNRIEKSQSGISISVEFGFRPRRFLGYTKRDQIVMKGWL